MKKFKRVMVVVGGAVLSGVAFAQTPAPGDLPDLGFDLADYVSSFTSYIGGAIAGVVGLAIVLMAVRKGIRMFSIAK